MPEQLGLNDLPSLYIGPGTAQSPGGFVFGPQGWTWGQSRVTSITFFLDNTAMVCDQYGRPIRGTSHDGKETKFALTPPASPFQGDSDIPVPRGFATHAQVVAALEAERIDWTKLTCAGWPQLPYDRLKELTTPNGNGQAQFRFPSTPEDELRKIRDPKVRKDALRLRREWEADHAKELELETEEE